VLTVGLATALYLPLFLATATVGRPEGVDLRGIRPRERDATMVAAGAERYLGDAGFWWVMALTGRAGHADGTRGAAGRRRTARARRWRATGTLPRCLLAHRGGRGAAPRRGVGRRLRGAARGRACPMSAPPASPPGSSS
jgi:hypothetical protein